MRRGLTWRSSNDRRPLHARCVARHEVAPMTADAAARPDQTFSRSIRAPWSDMDQNGHMRTTAYLAATEDVRMQFFDAAGVTL